MAECNPSAAAAAADAVAGFDPESDGMSRAASTEHMHVEWSSVDLAAQSSLRMALALGLELENAPRGGGDKGKDDDVLGAAAVPLPIAAAIVVPPMPPALPSSDEGTDDDDDGQGDEDDDGDEPGMAGCRTATWDDATSADYVVSAVTNRRRDRSAAAPGPATSGTAALLADECGAPTEALWEYRVEWAGGYAPSWEPQRWLLEQGYGALVRAVDERKAAFTAPTSTRAVRPKKPSGLGLSSKQQRAEQRRIAAEEHAKEVARILELQRREARRAEAEVNRERLVTDLGRVLPASHVALFARLLNVDDTAMTVAEALVAKLIRDAAGSRVSITHVCVVEPSSLPAFNANTNPLRTSLVYHGTFERCVRAIADIGLRMPGVTSGVSVRHGSAYGVGIYLGFDFATSAGYAPEGFMFLGAAKPGLDAKLMTFGVLFDESEAVPLIAVKFSRNADDGNDPCILEANTLVAFDRVAVFNAAGAFVKAARASS